MEPILTSAVFGFVKALALRPSRGECSEALRTAEAGAREVAHRLRQGKRVLVTCMQGRNRSGVLDVRTVIRRGERGEADYGADACVMGPAIRRRGGAKRCQYGSGDTPTAAIKAALSKLARSLK